MGGWLWKLALIFLLVNAPESQCRPQESSWAKKLGDELWHLSQVVTKHSVIKSKYRTLNASVNRNDGRSLLNQIIDNISKMVQAKITAVKCMAKAAEKSSEEYEPEEDTMFEYYNMKYSPANGVDYTSLLEWALDNDTVYKSMSLRPDRNFYNVPVNTSYSGVHVPTNLYDKYPFVKEAITWSEDLDEIFRKNYDSDQTLVWQYFGTASGMMRQYPAMHWKSNEEDVDLYDCRTRPWFIEAATCAKDIVILMDNSGSMTGMRNTIAKLVVKSILDTFGNNDYVNVLKFSWTAEPVLPCYSGVLVQSTTENVEIFQDAVTNVKPEGNASFPNAFTAAFKLLEKFRNTNGGESNTNQAIMLVTDGLPGNITDVFEMYNPNGTVRVFTYLVGTEVKGVLELQQMACQNRGYYVHIHNLDEVRDQVLKYIPVMARPLILNGEDQPVIWTHAFTDVSDPKLTSWLWKVMKNDEQKRRLLRLKSIKPESYSQEREDAKYVRKDTQEMPGDPWSPTGEIQGEELKMDYQEYRLTTSASMPVFDNKSYIPELLGVVGTDVPVSQFYSLTYPYKIGANGYAFIITNNGFLILHPELRPVFDGLLKMNYNSVDLAEVEVADDDGGYKEFNQRILELRNGMVNRAEDEILDVDIKFLYDDMRRVWTDKRDYYFSPLPGTPFSIGLAIPSDYGDNQIGVGDVIKKNFHQGIPLYKFLMDKDKKDNEWRIHPDWTYCKYFNASYKSFETPEDELLHFLEKMSWEGKKSKPQYGNLSEDFDYYENCTQNGQSHPADSYYCDEDLIQLLLFDAQVTEPFRNPKLFKNEYEEKLLKTYKATLRFVSTQSGLTRWQLVPKPVNGETSDFGNAYPRAIDESWYKAAVLQHEIDRESFVFSVTHKPDDPENAVVTATHAIFPIDGGKEAPASVVGFQFTQKSLYDRYKEITKMKSAESSSSDHSRESYIIDHNGYIIMSTSDVNDTGIFFGEIEGEVMLQLVEEGFYRKIEMYDYQGLCIEKVAVSNLGSLISKPLGMVWQFVEFVVADLVWNTLQVVTQQLFHSTRTFANPIENDDDEDDDDDEDEDEDEDEDDDSVEDFVVEDDEEKVIVRNITIHIERHTWPCDKNVTLYLLNYTTTPIYSSGNSRLHFAEKIPHTNMALIVLYDSVEKDEDVTLSVEPMVLPIETCHKANINNLPRTRMANCCTYHPIEEEIEACGRGTIPGISLFSIFVSSAIAYLILI